MAALVQKIRVRCSWYCVPHGLRQTSPVFVLLSDVKYTIDVQNVPVSGGASISTIVMWNQ